jgi:hypothetical protein
MTAFERMTADQYRQSQGLPPRGSNPTVSFRRGEQLDRHGALVAGPAGKAQHMLGRLGVGIMNKTEARFEREVLAPAKERGEIAWYGFEAVKFRIAANRCWLTIDFLVLYADGHFEAIDVKGARAIVEEDAKVKMKVAAASFPIRFRYAFPRPRKLGGGWLMQEV